MDIIPQYKDFMDVLLFINKLYGPSLQLFLSSSSTHEINSYLISLCHLIYNAIYYLFSFIYILYNFSILSIIFYSLYQVNYSSFKFLMNFHYYSFFTFLQKDFNYISQMEVLSFLPQPLVFDSKSCINIEKQRKILEYYAKPENERPKKNKT